MKWFRILAVTLSFLVLSVMLVGCIGPETVAFPDENLEAAIRDALGKPLGEELTPEELAGLTTLSVCSSGITNLSCLDYCTNLTEVSLSGNQISDILPLVENSGLGVGDWLCLENNNRDLGEGSKDMEYIRTLKDKGVMVEY